MSGVYINVWDFNEGPTPNFCVLAPTKGGAPHLTFLYAKGVLEPKTIVEVGASVLKMVATTTITATEAVVSSFTDAKGNFRHDVLLHVDDATVAAIELLRETHVAPLNKEGVVMRTPHITVANYAVKADAEKHAAWLNSIAGLLPRTLKVTGVSV